MLLQDKLVKFILMREDDSAARKLRKNLSFS